MKKSNILELLSLSHSFIQGKKEISVLENINLSVGMGEIVSLEGPSGIGKSTLLQIAGLLETPTKGDVVIDAISCKNIADIKKSSIRGEKIGFIYQFHHLLSEFSALENIAFPRLINGEKKALAFERANELLNKMGLAHRINNRPAELSGGEQQRVAIARA
ncbi:MAG: ATP-binding cassette domain-containing protein, partial [Pseudomonadota bacterium]|nr:ATP-binding cassette domain-containing protein [Pseudomonadota bacterium]